MLVQKIGSILGKRRRILFLQGPMGPFFFHLRSMMQAVYGVEVTKVNFNGGDLFFSPLDSINFKGSLEEWPEVLRNILSKNNIEQIFLYGDCRPIHKIACEVAKEMGVEVAVFEEGYIRPNFVTLEPSGVNGHSHIPKNRESFYSTTRNRRSKDHYFQRSFFWYAVWTMFYYVASVLCCPFFRFYQHHRPLSLAESLPWARGIYRYYYYKFKERGKQQNLIRNLHKEFYLVPLQVHNDYQLLCHANGMTIEHFIKKVIKSFSQYAENGSFLVFKHHPMDRAYTDYRCLINHLSRRYKIEGRVLYLHDQHLPTLLASARGLITINSTVGLSSLFHKTPVKTLATAVYDIDGLTYQGSLCDFWHDAASTKIDQRLYQCFMHYLKEHSQVNDNFYKGWYSYRKPKTSVQRQPEEILAEFSARTELARF